jgi:hypothetical protein
MLIATATKKSNPMVTAAYLRVFRFANKVAGPSYDDASKTVINRIIDVTANHKVKEKDVSGGNCTV